MNNLTFHGSSDTDDNGVDDSSGVGEDDGHEDGVKDRNGKLPHALTTTSKTGNLLPRALEAKSVR